MRPGILPSLAVLLLLALPVRADVEVEVNYGFGGQAVSGALTPLTVRVKSHETTPLAVQVTADYRSGRAADERWSTADTVSPQGEKVFTFYGRGVRRSSPRVTLEFDRQVLVSMTGGRAFKPSSSVEIEVADPPGTDNDSPACLQVLAAGPKASLLPMTRYAMRVMPIEETALPDVWYAYEGIDVVLLRNPGEEIPLEPGAQEALLAWVESGGRLVVSATRRPDLIADTLLGRALPAHIGSPIPGGADYVAIAALLSGQRKRRDPPEPGPVLTLAPSPGAAYRSVTTLGPRSTVLWAETRRGLGSILVLAFDTARLARADDAGADALFGLMLRRSPRSEDTGEAFRALFEDYEDYQLLTAQQDYPAGLIRLLRTGSSQKPPMVLLSLFMVLYVLVIGPFDYFFLKRRRKLAWSAGTLILTAVVFSATAWFVSFYLFAGSIRVNRFTFADIAPFADGSGLDRVRVYDMASHYEPRGGTVTLRSEGWDTAAFSPLAEPDAYLQWGGGLPGDGFDSRPVRAGAAESEFRIPFRSVRGARSTLSKEDAFPLDIRYEHEGTVSCRSDLPYDLNDAHLVYQRGPNLVIVPIGLIPAGSSRDVPAASISARTFTSTAHRIDAANWTAQLLRLSDGALAQLGRDLMGLSIAGCLRDGTEADLGPVAERVLSLQAIDRSAAVTRGAPLLLAWTSARDPFGLGSGDEDGFTITVIRRWIEP